MEQISQIKILEAEIRESFGKVVYSQKIQDECAARLSKSMSSMKRWQIILSAVSTGGFLSVGFDVLKTLQVPETYATWGNSAFLLLSGIVSLALLCLNTYAKENDFCSQSQEHKNTANRLWVIREKYIFLLTSIKMGDASIEELKEQRTKLFEETADIYSTAPATNAQAYADAQKALKQDEELTFSKEELDHFLPKELQFDSPVCTKEERPRHIIADE